MRSDDIRAMAGDLFDPPGPPSEELRDRIMRSAARMEARRRRRLWQRPVLGLATLATAVTGMFLLQETRVPEPEGASHQATELLRKAAHTAENEPEITVLANQFVFTETSARYPVAPGSANSSSYEIVTVYAWRSADGTRDGLTRQEGGTSAGSALVPGCSSGTVQPVGPDGKPIPGKRTPCTPDPAYQPGLPQTPGEMRNYLYRQGGGSAQGAFGAIGALLKDRYLPPKIRAVLFKAATTIPGVDVAYGITDAAGRPGIAIARTEDGTRQELVFAPDTFTFRGWQVRSAIGEVDMNARPYAIIRTAVTSVAGTLP
ncbi:CU044_5270 family protein [Longispora albida]|uniref:CU044_5270 family protein n=1 Tax=Longispora albida TaxID=203523 RepID=UPI00037006A9|nr:CU044_5270 family protein [Longispora albida]